MPPRKEGDRQFSLEENIVAYTNARLRVQVCMTITKFIYFYFTSNNATAIVLRLMCVVVFYGGWLVASCSKE